MKRRTVLAGAAVAAVPLLSACKADSDASAGTGTGAGTPAPSATGSPSPAGQAGAITIAPAANAANVSPGAGVVVTVAHGKVNSVTVTAGTKQIAGAVDDTGSVWRSTAPLAFNQKYTVTASGVGEDGAPLTQTLTFTTLKPSSTANATFQANLLAALKDGGTYGVGQSIMLRLAKTPSDKAAIVKALKVVAEPAVEGRWHWTDSRTLQYRPEKYWASGTKITVAANLLGTAYGKGVFGAANVSVRITIGKSKVAIADDKTHHMKIYFDGVEVKDFPISMGMGGGTHSDTGEYINYFTRSGVHVVMSRELTHHMSSTSYGVGPGNPNYYAEDVQNCCRITYSGEFVHSAPWSEPNQGKRNVSHGCVNVSDANGKWFYDNFNLGDVVDIRGTVRKILPGESIGDWEVPWDKWGTS